MFFIITELTVKVMFQNLKTQGCILLLLNDRWEVTKASQQFSILVDDKAHIIVLIFSHHSVIPRNVQKKNYRNEFQQQR